ncbi:MAG: hypothetical protein IT499_14515 [Rubrivivax sp.]|nr:hypothetical protein [Rubrivivax sp.]MCL4697688.1 hypothetical protein [Burkholderiaceae bacterium]
MNRLWLALLPDLRRFPPAERADALREARGTALDAPELLGLAAGLVGVVAFTRYALAGAVTASPKAALNFGVALPLLALLLGPVHLRRLKRGLRDQIERREPR